MAGENITIQLLGPPQVLRDGRPVQVTRRKSRALLYYLAAHDGPVQRARLLSLFWPDSDRPAAQQTLRTTLHGLRQALGDALAATDATLGIAPGAAVDVRLFATALAGPPRDAEALADALERYRGEFLADFSLPDSPEFDDWVTAERERYRRMAVRGLVALAEHRQAAHDPGAALDSISRAAALDPLQEEVQRAAMRIQYLAGDRAGAIRRYEQLRALLDAELGVPPLPATRELYDAIITDTLERSGEGVAGRAGAAPRSLGPPPARPPAGELPFVGRADELAALQALAPGTLALIEGEPGIGKTFLAEQFIRVSGRLALAGAARELEQPFPYHPVVEALRGLLAVGEWSAARLQSELPAVWFAELGRLLPELGAPPSNGRDGPYAADEARLWESLYQLLATIARRSPLVLFIDDLQWADRATLGLLGYLARRGGTEPVSLVGAARPVSPRAALSTLLGALTRERRLVRLPLGRLTPDEVAALARRVSPNFPAPLADWLTHTAEGNPYITTELVRYAHDHVLLGPNGTLAPGAPAAPIVPQTVRSLILSRVARLSEPARRFLDTAVAVGREFALELVAHATALSEPAMLDALDELREAGLIVPEDGGRYAFDHSLTLEVIARETDEPRSRRLHRRIAEAIEESSDCQRDEGAAEQLAWHFRMAGEPRRAAPYALRAGRRAAGLSAWQEAIALFRQALGGIDEPQRLPLLMELGQAHIHIGEMAAASEALRDAIELARRQHNLAGVDAARLALGKALLQEARFGEVIELAQQMRASGHPGSAVHAELLWGIALSVEGADLRGAFEHLLLAEQLCDALADAPTLAHIKFERGSVLAQQGDLAGAIALYRESLAALGQADSATLQRILAHNNLGYHLHLLGDPEAIDQARAGMRLAQERGALGMQPFLHSTLGEIALAAGDLDTAEREFAEGLALAERLHMPERIAGLTANLGLVALRRGESTLAVHRLSSALAQADALGTPHLATQIRIWLAPLLPPAEARAQLAIARAVAESSGRGRLLEEIARVEAA